MKKILLIGYGKMGSSIVNGWTKKKINFKIFVIEKEEIKSDLTNKEKINFLKTFDDFRKLNLIPDLIFVAVKPQQLPEIKNDLKLLYNIKSVFVSIVAGISIEWFRTKLSNEIKIVRAMPNTPAAILKGITGIYHTKNLRKVEIDNVKKTLMCIGKVVVLKKEYFIDIVTSISGSGPAYFFLLSELLIKLGKKLGLEEQDAELLSTSTFIGSANLLDLSDSSVQTLRKNVTSPGGTTEAAIEVLLKKENSFEMILEKAVNAAILRAKKLNIK